MGHFLSFGTKDVKKVHMPQVNNLIIKFNIVNCIFKRFSIDLRINVSLLYVNSFQEIGILQSMLTPPPSTLNFFSEDLLSTLRTVLLSIKIGNDNGGAYIHSEEIFYLIDATSRHITIISHPWIHIIGAILSSLYQVMKFLAPNGKLVR